MSLTASLSGPGAAPQVPLSAIEHYAYCPRQAGLILLEDGYEDDANTTRGTLLHQRVHDPGQERRGPVRTLRALPVWHDGLGIAGVCDLVEMHANGRVVPVEYKVGRYVPGGPADVQVAAQALCLEAMFHRAVPTAAVWSARDRRRHTVTVDAALRDRVATAVQQLRATLTTLTLPPAAADARCRGCSMRTSCMPRVLAGSRAYATAARQMFDPAEEARWDG